MGGKSTEGQEVVLSTDYIKVGEYLSLHPEQKSISKKFVERVQAEGVPIHGNVTKEITIAFIYPGKQISDYWHRSVTAFKKRMDEIGIQYKIQEFFSKPAVEIAYQEEQMNRALKSNPDYLVFTLDAKKHRYTIERLLTRKRPKLILQNITTPIRKWEGKQPFLYVGFDHEIGSKMLANYFMKKTKRTGNYSLLYFTQGYVSMMRGDTFVKYLKDNSDLKLISSYYTDGNRNKSRIVTDKILKQTKPDFIYSSATDITFGVIEALKGSGNLGKVMINGWGGGDVELDALAQGEIDVTVMRMNDDNGVAMAEAIRLDLENRGDQVPTIYSGEFVLVEKGINRNALERLKQRAFRYSK